MKLPVLYDFEAGTELNELPETFLWKNLLYDSMVSQSDYSKDFGLNTYQSVLFAGGPGNGKHTFCEALKASIYQEQQKYSASEIHAVEVFLDCSNFEGISDEEREKLLTDLYQKAGSYPLAFISFEQMDRYEQLPLFFVDIFPMLDTEHVYTFFFLEDDTHAETNFLKETLICRCSNPSDTMRQQYLRENLSWTCRSSGAYDTFLVCGDTLSTEDVVRETSGYSYWDLERLVSCLKREAASRAMDPRYAREENGCLKVTLPKEQFQMYLDAFRPARQSASGAVIVNAVTAGAGNAGAGSNTAGGQNSQRAEELLNKDPEQLSARQMYEMVAGIHVG